MYYDNVKCDSDMSGEHKQFTVNVSEEISSSVFRLRETLTLPEITVSRDRQIRLLDYVLTSTCMF